MANGGSPDPLPRTNEGTIGPTCPWAIPDGARIDRWQLVAPTPPTHCTESMFFKREEAILMFSLYLSLPIGQKGYEIVHKKVWFLFLQAKILARVFLLHLTLKTLTKTLKKT